MYRSGRPNSQQKAERRAVPPLDPARLEALALHYVARFSTTASKFERYLRRKLIERGWDHQDDAPVAGLVARMVEAGYIDDAAFARARTGSLLRRGLGARRIDQDLNAAGIGAADRDEARATAAAERHAALACARRRKLGPYGAAIIDRAAREKQLGAMLRAGHRLDSARELVNSTSIAAAEEWAEALDNDTEDADG